jgi:hypothetical protein
MTLSNEDLNEEIDDFVDSLLQEHELLTKNNIAGALETKAHELYDEDDEEWNRD